MHSRVGHSKQKVSNSAKSLLCYLQYDASILSIPIYEWFRVSTEYTQHQGVRNLNLIQGVFRKYSRKGGFLNKTKLSFQSIISSTLFPESSNHVFKSIPSTRVYTSNVKGAMSQDCLPLFFALNTLQSTVCGPLMNRLKQFRELGRDDPPVMIPPVMIPLS